MDLLEVGGAEAGLFDALEQAGVLADEAMHGVELPDGIFNTTAVGGGDAEVEQEQEHHARLEGGLGQQPGGEGHADSEGGETIKREAQELGCGLFLAFGPAQESGGSGGLIGEEAARGEQLLTPVELGGEFLHGLLDAGDLGGRRRVEEKAGEAFGTDGRGRAVEGLVEGELTEHIEVPGIKMLRIGVRLSVAESAVIALERGQFLGIELGECFGEAALSRYPGMDGHEADKPADAEQQCGPVSGRAIAEQLPEGVQCQGGRADAQQADAPVCAGELLVLGLEAALPFGVDGLGVHAAKVG